LEYHFYNIFVNISQMNNLMLCCVVLLELQQLAQISIQIHCQILFDIPC